MIGVDTNILVYAHRRDSEWHSAAAKALAALAEGETPWAIPWPCIHEFLAMRVDKDVGVYTDHSSRSPRPA